MVATLKELKPGSVLQVQPGEESCLMAVVYLYCSCKTAAVSVLIVIMISALTSEDVSSEGSIET